MNGDKINAKIFNELLASLKSGDTIKIFFTTAAGTKEKEITLSRKKERIYAITSFAKPGALQVAILKGRIGESR